MRQRTARAARGLATPMASVSPEHERSGSRSAWSAPSGDRGLGDAQVGDERRRDSGSELGRRRTHAAGSCARTSAASVLHAWKRRSAAELLRSSESSWARAPRRHRAAGRNQVRAARRRVNPRADSNGSPEPWRCRRRSSKSAASAELEHRDPSARAADRADHGTWIVVITSMRRCACTAVRRGGRRRPRPSRRPSRVAASATTIGAGARGGAELLEHQRGLDHAETEPPSASATSSANTPRSASSRHASG